jgi:actin-related protein 6
VFTPSILVDTTMEVVFEELGYASYAAAASPSLASYNPICRRSSANPCLLVIESGFSFSHSVPIMDHRIIKSGVRRVDVGGKLITNYLRELISYRQWNMMDETHLVSLIKEKVCFVSDDFLSDLRRTDLKLQYVLPDYVHHTEGYVRGSSDDPHLMDAAGNKAVKHSGEEQVLTLKNERFSAPEVLFRPTDIGLSQAGLAEACLQGLNALDNDVVSAALLGNIAFCGGNAAIPGACERLSHELQSLAPDQATQAMLPISEYVASLPCDRVFFLSFFLLYY